MTTADASVRPFRIAIAQADLDDLAERLARTRWANELPLDTGGPQTGPVPPGWDALRTARAWAELRARLGYDRYGAHGNDAGAIVAPLQGRVDPEHVLGVHVTRIFSFPSGDPGELEGLSPEELQYLSSLFRPIRRFAERDHANIVSWSQFDRGSHWAAHDAPDLLVGDLRQFFRGLRAR